MKLPKGYSIQKTAATADEPWATDNSVHRDGSTLSQNDKAASSRSNDERQVTCPLLSD